jgi:hypothetical protein
MILIQESLLRLEELHHIDTRFWGMQGSELCFCYEDRLKLARERNSLIARIKMRMMASIDFCLYKAAVASLKVLLFLITVESAQVRTPPGSPTRHKSSALGGSYCEADRLLTASFLPFAIYETHRLLPTQSGHRKASKP